MAQKRTTDHSKTNTTKVAEIAAILKKIEEKTARAVKSNLGDNWRENLFEIIMTRVDLAAPHKKKFLALPAAFRHDPKAIPRFCPHLLRDHEAHIETSRCLLPHPHHVAAFSMLYASIIDTFLKDTTRDHAKTMAALDKRLGYFEQLADFNPFSQR